ncbi:MAG: SLBB domain-containing protein [Candidatus Sabulitectum sp.]|nr:SLBB domain-containing protein [Candidatus Sabulitectum sp.]
MILFTGFVSLLLVTSVPLMAETTAGLSAGMGTRLTPADYFNPDEYLVSPGDEIWMSFPGGVPFSGMDEAVSVVFLPVGLDGILNIPAMQGIDTNGMTLQTLQDTISDLFARAYRGMIVSAGLARSASFQIPVTGQIRYPGIVTVNGLSRLTEALARAGGVSSTGASSDVLIISISGDSTAFNLNDFLLNGNLHSNPLVQRNSRIHVPTVAATIIIEGALSFSAERLETGLTFTNRMLVEFIPGESAREAIARVGGASSTADLHGCFVYRLNTDSVSVLVPFSLQDMAAASVPLQPGDRIVVPSSSEFINVTGEIIAKAPVPYSPGMSVNYYIGMAGGFNSVARRNSVKVVLSDGEKIDVNLTDIVLPGATIEVPRVPIKFWEEYLTILTGLATVVIAYQSIFSN